jgi:hypothetical protein
VRAKKKASGKRINELWHLHARQALFSKTGNFYMPLERFPGVLCGLRGFARFKEEEEFDKCDYFGSGKRMHFFLEGTIADLDGYELYETNAKQRGMNQSEIDRAKAEMLDW